MPYGSGMDHVGSLLSTVLRKRGLMGQASAALATHLASQWLVENLAQCCDALHVRSCKEGTLLIEAEHSIAAQECQMISDELLQYLRLGGQCRIENIRVMRCAQVQGSSIPLPSLEASTTDSDGI